MLAYPEHLRGVIHMFVSTVILDGDTEVAVKETNKHHHHNNNNKKKHFVLKGFPSAGESSISRNKADF